MKERRHPEKIVAFVMAGGEGKRPAVDGGTLQTGRAVWRALPDGGFRAQ